MDNKLKDKWAEPEAIEAIIERHVKKLFSRLHVYNNHLFRGSVPHPTTSTKAVTGHVPPTTANAQEHAPPPPSSCRHSHTPSVAPKRVARVSQPVHATTPGLPQQRMATPNAKEGTDTTQCVRIWSDPPPLRGACLYLFTFTLVFTRALEYTQLQRTWL